MLPIKTKAGLLKKLGGLPPKTSLGLVPTMGALHQGHLALIKKAFSENDYVAVSIFINPTQFDNPEDLKNYPKTLDKDLELIATISPEIIVFSPTASEAYDDVIISSSYDFQGLDTVMEGKYRDDHFNGVGTIVEMLLKLVQPQKAYFGEKDFQQLCIIQKLIEIKEIPVEIVPCPIVREPHGLAMSSRNERLSHALRQKAGLIYKTLQTAKIKFGTESAKNIEEWVRSLFENEDDFKLEYFQIMHSNNLTPINKKTHNVKYRAFIAVYANDIRLIDNIALN